ncbi:MAG: serine hydrolase [Gemmatimonadota bacterium]
MRSLLSAFFFALAALACSDSLGPGSGPVTLSVISGNRQIGWQHTALLQPVVVEVVRKNGQPLAGARLTVFTPGGSGRVIDADSVTDERGRFQFRWELGEGYENRAVVSLFEDQGSDAVAWARARYLYRVPEETGDEWETASLAAMGTDLEPLSALMDSLRAGHYQEVHSVVIVKGGRLVFEEYFPGHDFGYSSPGFLGTYLDFDRNTRHNTHSATKSVVSALVGVAIDQGLIPSEEDGVFTFFPEYASLNIGGKDGITIRDLLTMSSGLEWHEWDAPVGGGQNDIDAFNSSGDHIHYVLGRPLVHEPGTVFNYNGGTVNVLCQIVARAAGMGIDGFADQHLFGPLGITNYTFSRLFDGFIACHGDIYITPRDMAKFGSLYLTQGEWQGRRILSEEWVQKSVAPTVSLLPWHLSWADDYGYLWWMKDYYVRGRTYTAFKAMGWGGQEIVVFPEQDMVVVFTGANYSQDPPCDEMLMRFILPALEG